VEKKHLRSESGRVIALELVAPVDLLHLPFIFYLSRTSSDPLLLSQIDRAHPTPRYRCAQLPASECEAVTGQYATPQRPNDRYRDTQFQFEKIIRSELLIQKARFLIPIWHRSQTRNTIQYCTVGLLVRPMADPNKTSLRLT